MNKNTVLNTMKKKYTYNHEMMMWYSERRDSPRNKEMYEGYYMARQAVGELLRELGLMTGTELQSFLDELNKKYYN